jgi:hypothetical protein
MGLAFVCALGKKKKARRPNWRAVPGLAKGRRLD